MLATGKGEVNEMDTYGAFINNYTAYTTESGMEAVIGRYPAIRKFSNLAGKTVLDFGCGPGTNGLELIKHGAARVIGIDISSEELEMARQVDPINTYLHYDGLHLLEALAGREIDAILASFSFCAIPSDSLTLILGEMRELLAVGGELVIIDPNLERSLGVYYLGELHYHAKPDVKSGDHVHVTLGEGEHAVELFHDIYRTHADYQHMLQEAGFSIQVFEEVQPPDDCQAGWAEVAREYPPFLLIKAVLGAFATC